MKAPGSTISGSASPLAPSSSSSLPRSHMLDRTRCFPPSARSPLCPLDASGPSTSLLAGVRVWTGPTSLPPRLYRTAGFCPLTAWRPPRCAGTLWPPQRLYVLFELWGRPLRFLFSPWKAASPRWLCSHLPPDRESPPDPARGPSRPGTSGVCFFHDCLPTTLGLVEGRAWVLSGWVERGRKGSKGFGGRHRGGSLCTLWWASPPLSSRALVTSTLSPCAFSPAWLLGSIIPNLFSPSLPSSKPAPMHPFCSRTLPFTASSRLAPHLTLPGHFPPCP